MKKIYLISIVFMIFVLVACNNSIESNPEQDDASNADKKSQEVNLTQNEKPPGVTITFGEEVVKTSQGGYSWSYLDSKTGEMVSVEADSIPSTELVDVEDAVRVNLNEPITLNFENEPLKYEIRVYDNNDDMIATYNDFEDIKAKEKAVYEILVTWEEGTGIYAVALDIQ